MKVLHGLNRVKKASHGRDESSNNIVKVSIHLRSTFTSYFLYCSHSAESFYFLSWCIKIERMKKRKKTSEREQSLLDRRDCMDEWKYICCLWICWDGGQGERSLGREMQSDLSLLLFFFTLLLFNNVMWHFEMGCVQIDWVDKLRL